MTFALALSSRPEFWPKQNPLHFLADSRVPESTERDWRVLPYPWDDRAAFLRAADYVTEAYETLLPVVADALNRVHSMRYSTRYWRIVVGSWLHWDLQVLYDHYVAIRAVVDDHPDLCTVGLAPESYLTPTSFSELAGVEYWGERYNLQLNSQLLAALGVRFAVRKLAQPEAADAPKKPGGLRAAVTASREALHRGMEALTRRADVGLVGTGLPFSASLRLLLSSRFRIAACAEFAPVQAGRSIARDESMRNDLEFRHSGSEFERIALDLLRQNMPRFYLEGFAAARHEAQLRESRPRVWLSANSWYFDEAFKLTAGEALERGARILSAQHGGYYGMLRTNTVELHEQEIGDTFYTWGWRESLGGRRNTKPLPALKLAGYERSASSGWKRRARPYAVFTSTAHPRQLLRFLTHPSGPQWARYHEDQLEFMRSLSPARRQSVFVRFPGYDFGWNLRKSWQQSLPDVRFDTAKRFTAHFGRARLMVMDHPATTFLESLAANVPTLLFWNPSAFLFRDEAVPFVEALRHAGILWDSPQAAAVKCEEILSDVDAWWTDSNVQKVRRDFCARYALTSHNWVEEWKTELFDVLEATSAARGHDSRVDTD